MRLVNSVHHAKRAGQRAEISSLASASKHLSPRTTGRHVDGVPNGLARAIPIFITWRTLTKDDQAVEYDMPRLMRTSSGPESCREAHGDRVDDIGQPGHAQRATECVHPVGHLEIGPDPDE